MPKSVPSLSAIKYLDGVGEMQSNKRVSALEARVGEEKVWVEAEQAQDGSTVLTLADVRARRDLAQRLGKHNAKVRIEQLKNFPPNLVDELNRGYPVRFKMFQSAFEKLLEA